VHFVFIPFGKRSLVELLLREMEAQKFKLPVWKGEKEKPNQTRFVWLQGAIRMLPFGIHEYVFPREALDAVLATLLPVRDRYPVGWVREAALRKITNCEKLPEFDKKEKYLWITEHVNIIPIGIRRDSDTMTNHGENAGWYHEAI